MRDSPDTKLAELTQVAFPWRRQTLTLYGDRIELSVRGVLERYRTPFYLHSIKEEPDRILNVPWRGLALGAAMLVAGLAMAVGPSLLRHRGGAIVAGALGLIWLATQLPRMRRLIVFFYRTISGPWRARIEPQMYLWPKKPSPAEVERFLEIVASTQKQHVTKMREEEEHGPPPYTRELDRFAELRELEVVNDEEFARIKAKLLNIKPRRIGF